MTSKIAIFSTSICLHITGSIESGDQVRAFTSLRLFRLITLFIAVLPGISAGPEQIAGLRLNSRGFHCYIKISVGFQINAGVPSGHASHIACSYAEFNRKIPAERSAIHRAISS